MNIVISHVYSSNNNGDAAILSAQIAELKRTFPKAHFDILTVDTVDPNYTFDSVPVCNAPMACTVSPAYNRGQKLLLAFAMMGCTWIWALAYRLTRWSLPLPAMWRRPMQLLAAADMQVCVGGGYLRARDDQTSTLILVLLFHQIYLAKLLGKPVYLYAQSFGPYPKSVQVRIAKRGLKKADLILVREAKSRALLRRLGLPDNQIVQVPDSAFLFGPKHTLDARKLLGLHSSQQQVVGVTARTWMGPEKQTAYERALADFINYIASPELKVAVIAQVTSTEQNDDDRAVGRRLQRLVGTNDNVVFLDERFSHYEIKSIFARLTYLVGTRFHSVIFALTDYIPAIAIEYEHKTSGIMHDLELDDWVLHIEDVTADKLITLFDKLKRERAAYAQHLHGVLPAYVARAETTGELIKQAHERSQAAADKATQAPQP